MKSRKISLKIFVKFSTERKRIEAVVRTKADGPIFIEFAIVYIISFFFANI